MKPIFKTLAGSRLYGTFTENSDTDFKAVHLPTKQQILLGKRKQVVSTSTGASDAKNVADDVDTESFELQEFLRLAAEMQTIPTEMLFIPDGIVNPFDGYKIFFQKSYIWDEICANRHRILSRNTKSFIGYCKGQAVRYSMRGDRLATYEAVCNMLSQYPDCKVSEILHGLAGIENVRLIEKIHGEKPLMYLDVFGRQVPSTLSCAEALKVYHKPVQEAGKRAKDARDANGADWKALYHAARIVDQGITLFQHGFIEFPAKNREYLMKIRAGEVEMNAILDAFDEKVAILDEIGDNSPLAEAPDYEWIDSFVASVHEEIVRAG